jgi:uncharacterized protein (DUF2141 family)
MKFLWSFFLLFSIGLSAQVRLEVETLGVSASEGFVCVALYTEEDGFLKFDRVYRSERAPARKGATRVVIEDLPEGEYALAVFHDKNSDEVLNTNWLGIPKEPLGFSRARMKAFGPPGFRECLVSVEGDTTIEITLE